jgi:hypothetical protein
VTSGDRHHFLARRAGADGADVVAGGAESKRPPGGLAGANVDPVLLRKTRVYLDVPRKLAPDP